MMFADRIVASFRRPFGFAQSKQRVSKKRVDIVSEQVKKVLATSDQKLILMVRS